MLSLPPSGGLLTYTASETFKPYLDRFELDGPECSRSPREPNGALPLRRARASGSLVAKRTSWSDVSSA